MTRPQSTPSNELNNADVAPTEIERAPQSAGDPIRERLDDTRKAITHKFNVDGHEGYIIVGMYAEGRPGELFIKMAKQGSTISGLMDTIGILTSLTLQYGVSIETLSRKLEYVRFEPSGWTPNPDIRQAQSVIDYIYRWLGMQFDDEYRIAKQQGEQQAVSDPNASPDPPVRP